MDYSTVHFKMVAMTFPNITMSPNTTTPATTSATLPVTTSVVAQIPHDPGWNNSYLAFVIPVIGIVVGLPLLVVLAAFVWDVYERLLEAIEVKRLGAENSPRRARTLRGLPPLSFADPRCDAPKPPLPHIKAIELA